jgi:hypothetical protein
VKVFCDKGVAIHINPKPCVGAREGTDEASAGARTGRFIRRTMNVGFTPIWMFAGTVISARTFRWV